MGIFQRPVRKGRTSIVSPSVSTVMAPWRSVLKIRVPKALYLSKTSGLGNFPALLSLALTMAYAGRTRFRKTAALEEALP